MGNFSNDPQARLTESLGKHYVGVRMQQAVPVLDSDWNLLEDLRKHELESFGIWFIGSGVPTGSDGFAIFSVAAANDFGIRQGTCLAGGRLTENSADVTYATQPNFGAPDVFPPIAALTTPAADKSFIAYLDVWEREVDSQKDPALVDARIGVETAVRLKRDWVVRMARVPEDVPGLDTPPPGHVYLFLAQINRTAANANITKDMIVDLRDTQLSILRKIVVFDGTGVVVVDNARFAQMLQITSSNVQAFLKYISTNFNPPFIALTFAETLGFQAAALVSQAAQAGLANLNARTLANRGALDFLRQLYAAEQNLMTVWRDVVLQLGFIVKKYASYTNFVTGLDQRLNQPTVGTLVGLLPAINAGDLASAVTMQEEIARLIGSAAASIARGTIQISYSDAPPGNLLLGQLARFQFRVKSFTTQADTFTVKVLPATGWPRLLVDPATDIQIPNNKVTVPASGGETTLFIDVTVQAGTSGLQVQVTSDSNPAEIDQFSTLLTLTAGQPAPPTEDKIQFSLETPFQATIDNGIVKVSKPPAPQPGSVGVRIFNSTGQTATFALDVSIVPGTAVGTWTAALAGPNSIPINDGANAKPGGINITVGVDAVSCQIKYTASTTINGANVVGETVIPFVVN
jgi:hypothetical protein